MTFICEKCNKEFKSKYNLNVHLNKKIPCNKIKEKIKCTICNIEFERKNHKEKHEKTEKHLKNITINNNNINFNNIVNLTLSTNPFKHTNLDCIDYEMLENIYNKYINSLEKDDRYKFMVNFRSIIYLLEKIHFDLRNSANQNLRILLLFPNLEKKIIEYLILEINTETKAVTWQRLDYEEFLDKLIELLEKLNEKFEVPNFIQYIDHMKLILYKPNNKQNIEHMLTNMYKSYNYDQEKEKRNVSDTLNENINLYKKYRDNELKLSNGYIPDVINSLI